MEKAKDYDNFAQEKERKEFVKGDLQTCLRSGELTIIICQFKHSLFSWLQNKELKKPKNRSSEAQLHQYLGVRRMFTGVSGVLGDIRKVLRPMRGTHSVLHKHQI